MTRQALCNQLAFCRREGPDVTRSRPHGFIAQVPPPPQTENTEMSKPPPRILCEVRCC